MFLLNSRYPLLSATRISFKREALHLHRANLFPKLRLHCVKFLNQGFLKRLSILYSSTCVGLRYGLFKHHLEAFLGSLGLHTTKSFRFLVLLLRIIKTDLPILTSYEISLWQPTHSCATFLRPPIAILKRCRNINLLSIDYSFRPHLRTRLNLGGLPWPRKP